MRKINYSKVFILGVFVYIAFQLIVALIGIKTSTYVLKPAQVEVKTTQKALVIREESLVKSDITGTVSLLVDEDERVQKSSEVAVIYNKNIDENVNKEIQKLNKEIKEIKKSNNLLNEGILSSKEGQLDILSRQIKSNTSTFYATTSGVVSYKYDGNEEKYNIDYLEKINRDDINNMSNDYKKVVENNKKIKSETVIFRMINNNEIYLAYESNDNELYNVGNNVKIKFENKELYGQIFNIYEKEGYFITIIKITQQNNGIYDTRVGEFDIIYNQIECLKIPKKSIITRQNERGVFVVNEETKRPYFKAIKGISHEDEEYIYVDFRDNQKKGINTVKMHDRIILKPNFINEKIKIIS